MKTRKRRLRGRRLPDRRLVAALIQGQDGLSGMSEGHPWTAEELQQIMLDPRIVGVGGFPPIIQEDIWIAVQVKRIAELGPEGYVRAQLGVLVEVFAGYADMLAERVDIRSTEEIRQAYADMLAVRPDDPLVREMCEAGIALLDAELAAWHGPTEQEPAAMARLKLARQRMEAAMIALSHGGLDHGGLDRTRDEVLDFLRSWRPGPSSH